MSRWAVGSVAIAAAIGVGCGHGHVRAQSNDDKDLGGLVVTLAPADHAIDVDRAAKDPDELGRALARPYKAVVAALGPHTLTLATTNTVSDGATPVSELSDQMALELGDAGAYHAVYTNSADYGREVTFVGGQLYLRPRYQRWHQRAPETPDEPVTVRDQLAEGIAATWDLLAPAVELTDGGPAQIGGRAGRKIIVKQAPSPRPPPAEPLTQRKWRETRTIDGVAGEVVLDADSGLPLAVKLAGTVGYVRAGKHYTMKVSLTSEVAGVGKAVAIATPAAEDVVVTPERRREVDDRDFLLQNIAPPLRRNADGTAVAPQPQRMAGAGSGSGSASASGSGSASASASASGSGSGDAPKHHHHHHDDEAGSGSGGAP